MKKLNSRGFSVVELLLIVLVIVMLGGVGYYVYNKQKNEGKVTPVNTNQSSTDSSAVDASATVFKLDKDLVTFMAPKNWTEVGVGCMKDANKYASVSYLDSVALLPGEKLPTVYGDGAEYFNVAVCVFANPKNLTPQNWFEDASVGGLGEGTGTSKDKSSSDQVSGIPAYYRKTITDDYEEVNYVISSNGKIVYVYARTYDTEPSLPGVGDFTKFEPAIKNLVGSLKVN